MMQQFSHRWKKSRFLLLLSLTLVGVFYYSFLNESYELNQHLDEEELPHVTGDHGTQLTKDPLDIIDLSDWATVVEKNKYFPIVGQGLGGTKVSLKMSDDYFTNQKKITVRKWKRKEHYPVGKENYRKFPRVSKATDYPAIQSTTFTDGGKKDEDKLGRIRDAFNKSWRIYKEHAYGHDEVTPFSHQALDSFNGWSATLVDSLDTLWLMGLDSELPEAIAFVKSQVNFKQSFRDMIPIFENTIRILGGLLSAYEVSGDKTLLVACQEVGDLLMEAFDTPNRMPQMFYEWKSEAQNRLSSKKTHLAEIGTMSLEFSRLSQLTGDNKYYDAVDRITQMLYKSKNKFIIKGLYGNVIDSSGCRFLTHSEVQQGFHLKNKKVQKVISKDKYAYCEMVDYVKSFLPEEEYTLGGLGDSFYEYLPKMYHLLRGNPSHGNIYKEMYISAITQIKNYMLFTPNIPGGESTLFVTGISAYETKDSIELTPRDEMQHLACFAGGMVGLGAKLFSRPEDMEIAEKISLGCVNLYSQMGIMPETVTVDRANAAEVYNDPKRLVRVLGGDIPKKKTSNTGEYIDDNDMPEPVELVPAKEEKTSPLVDNVNSNQKDTSQTAEKKLIPDKAEKQLIPDKAEKQLIPDKAEKQLIPDKREVVEHLTVVEDSKPVNFNVVKRVHFPPLLTNTDGTKRWPVGSTYDQPIFLNDMDPNYLLRPEAIESVWYMYRLTGDSQWREHGWKMWENLELLAQKEGVFSAVVDVTRPLNDPHRFDDAMESFWFSETLKYYYLLFEDTSVWSLDEWVFNTEAHPFKLVD